MPINSRPNDDALSAAGGSRHIRFSEKFDDGRKRASLGHVDLVHAAPNAILSRYLSCFERRLPAFIDHKLKHADIQISSQIRIHHKDDVELHRLRRIQIALEGVDYDSSVARNEELLLIIDAFQIYIENFLKHNGKTSFILRCSIQQRKDHSEASIEIHSPGNFSGILVSLNQICHSPFNHFQPLQVAEMLSILFSNLSDSNCKTFLPFLILNYHLLDQESDASIEPSAIPSFRNLKLPANTLDRSQLLALDILMRSIEQSAEKSPYCRRASEEKILHESTKRFLTQLFQQIHTSNHAGRSLLANPIDCSRAFRAILKKMFTYSSSAMILTVTEQKNCVDYQIDRRYFELVMVFLQHLHRMNRRCANEDEQNEMIDYFSTVLFGDALRAKLSRRAKQIFLLLVEHVDEIKWSTMLLNRITSNRVIHIAQNEEESRLILLYLL